MLPKFQQNKYVVYCADKKYLLTHKLPHSQTFIYFLYNNNIYIFNIYMYEDDI
jgi:hypothetical protein